MKKLSLKGTGYQVWNQIKCMVLNINIFSKYGYKSDDIIALGEMLSIDKSDNHRINKRLGKWRNGVE